MIDRPYRLVAWVSIGLLFLPSFLQMAFLLPSDYGSYVVLSASMAPTLPQGSMVFVQDTGEYAVGDVVTFTRGSAVVTHRIVEQTGEGYVTQGDANEVPDAYIVTERQIHGELLFALPMYGHLALFAGTQVGALITVGLGAGLVVVGGFLLYDVLGHRFGVRRP